MPERFSSQALFSRFMRFPATLTAIWLFTLVFSSSFSDAGFAMKFHETALFFLFAYGCFSFLIEALFLCLPKTICYPLSLTGCLIPACLFAVLSRSDSAWWEAYAVRCSVCYFLILFSLGIYFCCRASDCSFEDYLRRVFGRTLRYHIVWFILLIGIALLCAILITLFDLSADILVQGELLLFGLYYMSSFLLSFYPEEGGEGALAAALTRYILPLLLAAAFFILYVYLLSVLILRNIPSNALFRITAALFLLGFPICITASDLSRTGLLSRICRFLPYLYLPLLPVQAYSIALRIAQNGLTPMRYAAVALFLFEPIALALYHFRRSALPLLFPLISVFVFVCGVPPYLNMYDTSFYSQKAALERYLALPEERQERIAYSLSSSDAGEEEKALRLRYYGALSYLKYESYPGKRYLDSLDTRQKQALDTLFAPADPEPQTSIQYGAESGFAAIPVEGWKSCVPFDYYAGEEVSRSGSSYPLLPKERPTLTVDVYRLLFYYMAHADQHGDIEPWFCLHRTYILDTDHALYLKEISFEYDPQKDSFSYVSITGYLLER